MVASRPGALEPGHVAVEGGDLTPSLKLRRRAVEQRYQSQLDGMYS